MILASQERIKEWTDKGAWGNVTLWDYFQGHAKENPTKICLADPPNREALTGHPPEQLTYADLARAVEATAEGLAALGVKKDDIILVQLPNTWELAMLYLAIARTGALISPLPMQWRRSELEYIASLTEAASIVTIDTFGGFNHREQASHLAAKFPFIKNVVTLEEIRKMAARTPSGSLGDVRIDPNDAFTLCWSSGTEAEPKGCPLSHNNWIFQGRFCYETAPIKPGDNLITAGPLVNMASVGTVYIEWLIGGGKLCLHHPFDGPTFIMQLIKEQIHYTLLVPAIVNALLKHPKVDTFNLSFMRAITIGAAPPSLWSVQELKRRWGIEFANIWGQNEGTANVAGPYDIPDLEMRLDHFPHYGKPGAKWGSPLRRHLRLKVIDPLTGKELTEEGAVGELWYRGPNVIPGYFRRPDLTAKAFDAEGFFNTGDLFQIKDNDCLGFFDRTKDIIIRGGFNISAQEVENTLLGHPKVMDVAAVAMPDEILGEKVCVYVVPKGEEAPTLEEIAAFMKERGVASYKRPERLEIVTAIPRNPVGKILKNILREDIKKKVKGE
ncbi:MAG TPA: class I adenylate-forming enzyme family protein [Syntrophales bacterium]|nr:class I adenylate-forming enzyme family protein [Syntrophales bacterium]HOM06638.1 class I adenylate-forming enzyme family protein [Syntrophales bacterium]HON99788.1 class I adenylate-forming enzyme family protein [Syntrophales bacterium]HPC01142.1 class I adenylate-forming enzyme family protein [Syntrophales bacterium]HPQ06299.1 class I adenylate-forming enzyme family protein [Syntrophales bacterium]